MPILGVCLGFRQSAQLWRADHTRRAYARQAVKVLLTRAQVFRPAARDICRALLLARRTESMLTASVIAKVTGTGAPDVARSWLSRTANTGCMGCSFILSILSPDGNQIREFFAIVQKDMSGYGMIKEDYQNRRQTGAHYEEAYAVMSELWTASDTDPKRRFWLRCPHSTKAETIDEIFGRRRLCATVRRRSSTTAKRRDCRHRRDRSAALTYRRRHLLLLRAARRLQMHRAATGALADCLEALGPHRAAPRTARACSGVGIWLFSRRNTTLR